MDNMRSELNPEKQLGSGWSFEIEGIMYEQGRNAQTTKEGHYEDHLHTDEKGQARARLQNEFQMPLKNMERSKSTLKDLARQSWRSAEWGC